MKEVPIKAEIPGGSARSGRGGRRFESSHSDHTFSESTAPNAQVAAQVSLLEALRERVLTATGPNRDLDCDIINVLAPPLRFKSDGSGFVTSSLDAALGLVERVLPGWDYGVSTEPKVHGKTFHAFVRNTERYTAREDTQFYGESSYSPTAPLALLGALLSALIAKART